MASAHLKTLAARRRERKQESLGGTGDGGEGLWEWMGLCWGRNREGGSGETRERRVNVMAKGGKPGLQRAVEAKTEKERDSHYRRQGERGI